MNTTEALGVSSQPGGGSGRVRHAGPAGSDRVFETQGEDQRSRDRPHRRRVERAHVLDESVLGHGLKIVELHERILRQIRFPTKCDLRGVAFAGRRDFRDGEFVEMRDPSQRVLAARPYASAGTS